MVEGSIRHPNSAKFAIEDTLDCYGSQHALGVGVSGTVQVPGTW